MSDGDGRVATARLRLGFIGAPLVFAADWTAPPLALAPPAHRLAAVLAAVIVLWVSEAIPMVPHRADGPPRGMIRGRGRRAYGRC